MIFYRPDIQLLPNPIELSCYKFTLRDRPQASLIWLRSFHAIYNHQLAPKVVAHLKKKCSNVRLTMVGPDKGDRSLAETREIAHRLDVSEQLEIVNGVPKAAVPNVLSKADIFLNTSNVDNTPISVLEAMASGLAIVSTNVGGIPHLLEDERTALLVPPNDPVLMAEAVHRILSEPELGKRLSGNARAKAEEFDWKTILPKWEALFTATAV
jgi:glycosyltransferase involved in cell wall biosynthesis